MLGLIFLTVSPCATASAGNRDSACATRFWVSMLAVSMSLPTSNVTLNCIRPSLELSDFMYSMRSTPLTCCSIGVATDCSTASAPAPGYTAVTWMFGGDSCGYCSMGSVSRVCTPISTIRIASTMARIGRRMKNCAMAYSLAGAAG